MEDSPADKSDAGALDRLGALIDHAGDIADDALLVQALGLAQHLERRGDLTGEQWVTLRYFMANAHRNRIAIAGEARGWDTPYRDLVLLELRRAVAHEAFVTLDPFVQCQILTNLGNELIAVGRPVEAIGHWDHALAINPDFGPALGNRAHGCVAYADALYDLGHSSLLLVSAYDSLIAACGKKAVFDFQPVHEHRAGLEQIAAQIAERIRIDEAREDLKRPLSLGRSRAERNYRARALENRLFLNPLNDLGVHSIAARDVLHLPSLTTGIDRKPGPPTAFGFYNQLKQEYISARWLAFEGLSQHRPHFSDRDTHLYDTLEIPTYSLAVEKTKLALRMAYSLFDKVAFFINDYFAVGLPEKAVSFRSVWLERNGEPGRIAATFRDRDNWSLRGLYWLAKDIYEPAFQLVAEPDAAGVAVLRHHLEHKYCQVHEDLGLGYSRFATSRNGLDLGYRIGRDMLEANTLQILKRARAALIYLSLAVHSEEEERRRNNSAELVMPQSLFMWRERGRL
ncbi:MAG: hypothetical protein JWR80_2896 [Bradyrhizobium sp.]|nr:hypothetical protein [Bradyrhizobium sp.]